MSILTHTKTGKPVINGTRVSSMSWESLDYHRSDLRAVINVQERTVRAGGAAPKLGQYWDEFHAVCGELTRRKRGSK